jgi:hypothetical protein
MASRASGYRRRHRILDASLFGAGISMLSTEPLRVDDRVELAFAMPSAGEETWLPAVVRWVRGERAGLLFSALDLPARSTLMKVLHG